MGKFAFNLEGIMLIFICGTFKSLSWVGLCLDTYTDKDFQKSNVMEWKLTVAYLLSWIPLQCEKTSQK